MHRVSSRRQRRIRLPLILAAICAPVIGEAAATPLVGVFNTGLSDVEDAGQSTLDLKFGPCEDDAELSCGVIVKIRNPQPDGKDTMPDGSPVLGFPMVKDLKSTGEGKYKGGKINAVDESLTKDKMVWYGFRAKLLEDGDLEARGCLGFVCPREMLWKRVTETDDAASADDDAVMDEPEEPVIAGE